VAPGSFSSGPAATPSLQTPPHGLPRMVSAPAIMEAPGGGRLPVVADMTTEESVATLAMPRAQFMKQQQQPSGQMPRLDPRLDSAAASIGNAQPPVSVVNARGVGPGGTQLVMVQRPANTPPPGKARPDEATVNEDNRSGGGLQSHPAGYYIPPAVAAALGRGGQPQQPQQQQPQQQPQQQHQPQQHQPQQQMGGQGVTGTGPNAAMPRLYDDPSQIPQSSSEGATQVYRPTGDTSARIRLESLPGGPLAAPPKRGLPLVMVLLGFLVIGFAAVAGVIWLLKG
jgi:hypothetical protein